MRHARIQKSKKHKKLKVVGELSTYNFLSDKSIEKLKDEQKIPRKLRDLIASKDSKKKTTKTMTVVETERPCTSGLNEKKMKKKKANTIAVKSNQSNEMEHGMTRPTKPLPKVMEKGTTESDGHFLNRINFMVAKAMAEAKLEEHFDVDLQANKLKKKQANDPNTKQQTLNNKPKFVDEKQLDAKQKERLQAKHDKQKRKDFSRKAKKLLKQRRLVKQLSAEADGLNRKEDIRFGERVHAPPTLTVPRRIAKIT